MMTKLIYFNKDNELIKGFTQDKQVFIEKKDFASNPEYFKNDVAICYGLSNYGEILVAKKNKINFIYIDNCYFGNLNSYYTDKKIRKNFYRIILNDFNTNKFTPRPDDRLKRQLKYLKEKYDINIGSYIKSYKYSGKDVIIVPPSGKILKICNIDPNVWTNQVVNIINSQNLNLNIIIRERAENREERFVLNPITELFQNAHSIVTYSSMSAVEAVISGVPSFIYNKENIFRSAAEPVSILGIENISKRKFTRNRYAWLSNLSYNQFSREEIASGYAKHYVLRDII